MTHVLRNGKRLPRETSSLAEHKILGLTLHAPWGELVAMGKKTIENRSWAPPDFMLGRYLAVHQSTRWDEQGHDFIDRARGRFAIEPPTYAACTFGVIAVARVVGWVRRNELEPGSPHVVKMLAGHAYGGDDWRWFTDEYGWVLRDVVRIAPVACRGLQKLWALPPLVKESVRRRWQTNALTANTRIHTGAP